MFEVVLMKAVYDLVLCFYKPPARSQLLGRNTLLMLLLILPFSFLSTFDWLLELPPLDRLAASSRTERFSAPLLVRVPPTTIQLEVRLGGKEAGPQTPLSVEDSSNASPESGVLPAEVFGLEPSLNN